jgi:hypothetical protein
MPAAATTAIRMLRISIPPLLIGFHAEIQA